MGSPDECAHSNAYIVSPVHSLYHTYHTILHLASEYLAPRDFLAAPIFSLSQH